MKLNLIDNAAQAYKLYSVQAAAVGAAVQLGWAALSPAQQHLVPAWTPTALTIGLAAVQVIVRLLKQDKPADAPAPKA